MTRSHSNLLFWATLYTLYCRNFFCSCYKFLSFRC